MVVVAAATGVRMTTHHAEVEVEVDTGVEGVVTAEEEEASAAEGEVIEWVVWGPDFAILTGTSRRCRSLKRYARTTIVQSYNHVSGSERCFTAEIGPMRSVRLQSWVKIVPKMPTKI